MTMKFAAIFALFVCLFSFAGVMAITESATLDDYVLDIEYEENDVNADESFRIRVTIKNEAGQTRTGIEVELEVDDPLDVTGDETEVIGTLEDNEEKTFSFRVEVDEDAEEQDEEIEITITDNSGTDETEDFTIEVRNDDPEIIIGSKNSEPTTITPDLDDVKLTLDLENIGDGDAEFTRVTLELPEGITSSGSFGLSQSLGTIASGENKEVEFFLDTEKNLAEGVHSATLVVQYEDQDNDKETQHISFDIPVKGSALFSITKSHTSPAKLTPGESGILLVTIMNTGSDKGEETTLRVFEHADLPFEFSQKTGLIGDLQPGLSGQASIAFEVDSDAQARRYLVRAQTRTITDGIVTTEDFTIPVTVSEAEPRSPIFYMLVVFVILAGLIMFFMLRR